MWQNSNINIDSNGDSSSNSNGNSNSNNSNLFSELQWTCRVLNQQIRPVWCGASPGWSQVRKCDRETGTIINQPECPTPIETRGCLESLQAKLVAPNSRRIEAALPERPLRDPVPKGRDPPRAPAHGRGAARLFLGGIPIRSGRVRTARASTAVGHAGSDVLPTARTRDAMMP